VAFFLASYARDALARIEAQASLPAFLDLRNALHDALGLMFEGPKGEHLFRSTLVQTLFYGLFSAWVEVAQQGEAAFDWRAAGWNLHVPFVDTLFQRIATPQYLRPLGLEEPLTWAAAALNRVERTAFFARFREADAVRYFYEPFLAAFDPELRRQLGVWYTPREIVRYMVERVDRVLRTELGKPDGLADPDVWVLDPCCGTGSYLVEVLDRIARTLREKGEDALTAEDLKQAAMTRIAGFEIMPAPYVIAHWQVGHALRTTGAPLGEGERAAVYLTNALTGWAPENREVEDAEQRGLRYTFSPLADEREEAARVKQERPILVVLGNPPYNAFAGTSPKEESGLVEPYKERLQQDWGIYKFNLDDLYVRFFRLAERRIAEATGRGIVCFISNHSWLWYPSYVVMRRRMLEEFDCIWLDNLNGSRYETGKLTPDGLPDPSLFSTTADRQGIQVGTAIALLAKTNQRTKRNVCFRDMWGTEKRSQLLADLQLDVDALGYLYTELEPRIPYRFALRPTSARADYETWALLSELAAADPIPGLLEMRREALISQDRTALLQRMQRYFDPDISLELLQQEDCGPVRKMARFDPKKARERALAEQFSEARLRTYYQRPFETSWCYHLPNAQFGTNHALSCIALWRVATPASSAVLIASVRTRALIYCSLGRSPTTTCCALTAQRSPPPMWMGLRIFPAPRAIGCGVWGSQIRMKQRTLRSSPGITLLQSVTHLPGLRKMLMAFGKTGLACRCLTTPHSCEPRGHSAGALPRYSIPTCLCRASPSAQLCLRWPQSLCRRSAAAAR
jgi:hypothetical protein